MACLRQSVCSTECRKQRAYVQRQKHIAACVCTEKNVLPHAYPVAAKRQKAAVLPPCGSIFAAVTYACGNTFLPL